MNATETATATTATRRISSREGATRGSIAAALVGLGVLWLAYDEKVATGTSLLAIVLTAAVGVATQGAYGNVDLGKAALVGVPALLGVVLGTAFQQRLSSRNLVLAFSALLVGVAVDLLVR